MSLFKYENGCRAEDKVTGFSGVITGRADYLTGCRQYNIVKTAGEHGEIKNEWIDESRVKLIGGDPIKLDLEEEPDGGPQHTPSKN